MCKKWISVSLLLSAVCDLAVCVPHQYHFVSENKNWSEAQSYCRQTYTDLATINNMEEMNMLNNILNDKPTGYAWIGLEDWSLEWQWSLKEGAFYRGGDTYRHWSGGQPDNYKGDEHCVQMYKENGTWNDLDCDTQLPFVCYDDKNNETYKLINVLMNWSAAQSYCRQHHTDLVSVRNQTENQQIYNLSKQANSGVWIGLYRDFWTWSDQSNSTFRYWDPAFGQPDNSGNINENCAAVSTTTHHWHDVKCDVKQPFICHQNTLILIKENLTWIEALTFCRQHHVDLVSVHSEEIQSWAMDIAQKASTTYVWVGLCHSYIDGFWFWVNGLSVWYHNWAPGYGTGEEDVRNGDVCGAVQSEGKQQWVSLPDSERLNFICSVY